MARPLLDICCQEVAACLLRGDVPEGFPREVPEPEICVQIYNNYMNRFSAAGLDDHPALLRHLLALQAFAEDWHVRQLRLALPQPRSPRSLTQLRLVSSRLQHLQLNSATWLQQLDWLLLAPPPAPPAQAAPTAAGATGGMAQPVQPPPLTCLILRDCAALQPQALTPLSHLAPTLRLLDLSGAAALDDGAAGVLACLRHLEASLCEAPQAHLGVLNLNYTAVGDATLAALTYGARVAAWARTHGAAPPPEAAAWPELSVHRLHLAGTRVTAAGVAQLTDLPRLSFLDGAVLATSNALAAALINHSEHTACACPPADMATLMAQGQASPAATSTRTRRRQQAARLRAARGLQATGEDLSVGLRDAAGAPAGAAVSQQPPVLHAAAAGRAEAAWGPTMGPGWQQQWATCGIQQLVDTVEALLRAEGRA
eukprot:XP_001702955.1 predicted protein [Chlamydomonas reinhardtii]